MANVLPPADEAVARRPDPEVIRAAYAADPTLQRLEAGWVRHEVERTARHKAQLEKLIAEYNEKMLAFKSLRRVLSNLRASIDVARSHARIKPKPARSVAMKIGARKSFIFQREREKFLKEKRIEFGNLVKEL